jgi:hypothetical protein
MIYVHAGGIQETKDNKIIAILCNIGLNSYILFLLISVMYDTNAVNMSKSIKTNDMLNIIADPREELEFSP